MARNLQQSKPWVVLTLIVLVVSFSGAHQFTQADSVVRAEQALDDALDYYAKNTSLEASENLRLIADPARLDQISQAHSEARSDFGHRRMPERLRARTQSRLDALVDRAYLAFYEANPGWRYGLTGRGDSGLNYLAHLVHTDSLRALVVAIVFLLVTGLALEPKMGSLLFAGFCAASAALTAGVFVAVHGDLGAPWAGPGGIVAACVGLYLLAGQGGAIPPVLVLPLWVLIQAFVVRDAWNGGVGSLPLWADGVGLAFGVGVGAALPSLRGAVATEPEESHEERVESLLAEAAALRNAGEAVDALKLLETELRQAPGDAELVRGFWDLAVSMNDAERAAPYVVAQIRANVRGGEVVRGVALWLALVKEVQEFKLETQVLVRLGEALLDEGHPEEAMDAMHRSLASTPPLSSGLAMRVVKVARDLDPGIAGRSAAIALRDSHLDPKLVSELEFLVSEVATSTYVDEPSLERPSPISESKSIAGGPDEKDTHSLFDTSLSADLCDETDWSEVERQRVSDPSTTDSAENRLQEDFNAGIPDDFLEELDPHAISPDALGAEVGASAAGPGEEATDPFAEDTAAEMPGDTAALIDDEQLAIGDDDLAQLDPNALSLSDFDAQTGELDFDELAPETAVETVVAPPDPILAPAPVVEPEIVVAPEPVIAREPVVAPEPVPEFDPIAESVREPEPDTVAQIGSDTTESTETVPPEELGSDTTESTETVPPEELVGDPDPGDTDVAVPTRSRRLKAVAALPLALEDAGLSLEIQDRGKTRITFDRIEALAVAAVGGLSAKPVIVVDVVLNWRDLDDELRIVRLRSDTFNPLSVVKGQSSPLEAMRAFLAAILDRSQAIPLPGEAAVRGPAFESFPDLVAYHRDVLSISD